MTPPVLVYPARYTDAREVVAVNAALDTTVPTHTRDALAWCRLCLDAAGGYLSLATPPMLPGVLLVAPVRPAAESRAA